MTLMTTWKIMLKSVYQLISDYLYHTAQQHEQQKVFTKFVPYGKMNIKYYLNYKLDLTQTTCTLIMIIEWLLKFFLCGSENLSCLHQRTTLYTYPIGKWINIFSQTQKLQLWVNTNCICTWRIFEWSFTQFVFLMWIGNSRWPPTWQRLTLYTLSGHRIL